VLVAHLQIDGAAQDCASGLTISTGASLACIREVTMRSPLGIVTTAPAPQPGVACVLQATRAAVALSAGESARCAFRSSMSGRRMPAPLTPCALNVAAKALP
jgi:hypothetical protein